MSEINYIVKSFDSLSLRELYGLLRLRSEIFVLEQNCAYQDLDNKDQLSYHVLGKDKNNDILAYTRLLPLGLAYEKYSSIGRVVVSTKVRRTGEGIRLMKYSIGKLNAQEDNPIKISAQCYLEKFYSDLGFEKTGEEYLEDGIPHMAMILSDK